MPKAEFFVIVHNVRSCYNVGSIFRTADALGAKKIYLSGYTPAPEDFSNRKKIGKTALGAEETVAWEKAVKIGQLIERLKTEGCQVVALEQAENSKNVFEFSPKFPLALILGNEVRGLSKSILEKADEIVEIPMLGSKESLNVSVAFGVAGYALRR